MIELDKFIKIFEGLTSAYGQTVKTDQFSEKGKHKTKSFTISNPVTKKLWREHLEGKDRLENGHYILTVGQHFVIIVADGGAEQALISMSSSQGKVSRKWNSMMMSISLDGKNGPYTPPSFSHSYKLTTVLNSGKGNQWYGYNVVKEGAVKDPSMYERAKKFYTSLASK